MTPIHRPGEIAPVEGTYVLVDRSGEALSIAVRLDVGERLPEVVVAGSDPIAYVRVDEPEAAA